MPRTARVDALDRRIVAALQRDGRRPFTSIGRELGISEAAVRQRVARLQAAGIMQVVAVADPMALGYQAMAMVGISVDGRARKQVAEAVGRLPEVSYLVLTAGSFDMLAEVVCEDNDHLLRLLSEDLAGSRASATPRPSCTCGCSRRPTPGRWPPRPRPNRGRRR
jgi:Lrp/AsnC family transcriptional regulator for asnA, asnC and gidA